MPGSDESFYEALVLRPAVTIEQIGAQARALEQVIESPPLGGGWRIEGAVAQGSAPVTQHPVAAICRTLRMARQTGYYAARVRPAGFYRRLDDETVFQQIRAVTNSRATYGYRRASFVTDKCVRVRRQDVAKTLRRVLA